MSVSRGRGLVAPGLVAVLALAIAACGREDRPIPDGPNVVVITTDDQSNHSFRRSVMPRTFELIADRGTSFRTAIAAPPLCCPSRAGFLTGQYPHNNGVFSNEPGYPELVDPGQVLPAWLQDAGYRTGFVGKYLNGTIKALGGKAAPGWDTWFEVEDLSYRQATGFEDGEPLDLGRSYTPAVLNEKAVEFIEEEAGERPFFLWLAQTAPHARNDDDGTCEGKAPQPLAEDLRELRDEPFPRLASFDEADVSDKPREIAGSPPLTSAEKRTAVELYRCTAASLQEVDRGVEAIHEALEREEEADETVVLFHSDNGLFFGEHRIRSQKGQVYEPALRVPMAMTVPRDVLGGRTERRVDHVVSNLDIAPTLLELTEVESCLSESGCREIDGRSLVELMRGGSPAWAGERGVLVEQGANGCRYAAIRTDEWLYNEDLEGGPGDSCSLVETELYDMVRDPDQLENVSGSARAEAGLAERLAALRDCAGLEGPNACE